MYRIGDGDLWQAATDEAAATIAGAGNDGAQPEQSIAPRPRGCKGVFRRIAV
jgi:hypothetical protein